MQRLEHFEQTLREIYDLTRPNMAVASNGHLSRNAHPVYT